jgi:hypothetical protein
MTKWFMLATGALLVVSAFPAAAHAQYFPLGNVLNNIGNAANPPPPATRSAPDRSPTAAPHKKGRVTHIIPPQSNKPMGNYPRETSAPSEDND